MMCTNPWRLRVALIPRKIAGRWVWLRPYWVREAALHKEVRFTAPRSCA